MNNWNHSSEFQFDSADLPFLPPSSTEPVSLESSTPFWKINGVSDLEKSFISPDYLGSNKPMFRSSFMKLLNVTSQSNENIANSTEDLPKLSSSAPTKVSAEQRRRLSQSLPVTPINTPGQTPLTTPHSSPSLPRKADMDAVTKAAIRCSNRLALMQQQQQKRPQDSKWFYMGFMPNGAGGTSNDGSSASCSLMMRSPRDVVAVDPNGQVATQVIGDASTATEKTTTTGTASSENPSTSGMLTNDGGIRRIQSDLGTRDCRRKYAFLMSNRDINFFAPTSMRGMALATITNIMSGCQDSVQSHTKGIRALIQLFNKQETMDAVESFLEEFIYSLKYSLIVAEPAPNVDRTIEFAVKFILAMQQTIEKAEEMAEIDSEDVSTLPRESYFVHNFWSFLIKSTDARNQTVRYRVCQMVAKLLNTMGEDVQMSEELYTNLQGALGARLSDKVVIVRVEAAKALMRLQDTTEDCKVTKLLLRYLGYDPQADVRKAILESLLPSKKVVVPVLGRTLDVKDSVRKSAYEYIANRFHMRSLTIAQRMKLLKHGMNERSETVKNACKQTLITSWCKMLGGDILQFLTCLDVQDASDVAELALIELLKTKCNPEFVASFNLLGSDRIIREDILSAESVFYWRVLIEHLKKESDEQPDVDLLDRVLPDLPPLCSFINKYAQSISHEDDALGSLDKEFICQQLLRIANLYDLVDEAHRKYLKDLVIQIFHSPKIGVTLVTPALTILKCVIPEPSDRTHFLMEIIADIREPIDFVEVQQTAQEQRENELALAKLRVEVNVARDELENYVEQQQFDKAQEAKDRLKMLNENVDEILTRQKPQTQEMHVEKNDDFTLTKCLAIACGILEDSRCKLEISRLHLLIDNLILRCVQTECAAVRLMAVRALGLACQLNLDLASRHLFLFLQIIQLDTEEIRLMAFRSVFDLIIIYGFESFKSAESEASVDSDNLNDDDSMVVPSTADSVDTMTDATGKLLSIFVAHLDSEITEVHTLVAEGLTKLLFSGRVISSKIVSRLCVMYFNPVNAENSYLLGCLGSFFPAFAALGVAHRCMLADAFLPTLRLLFQAPCSSPLSQIDVSQVGTFFIQLTRPPPNNDERLEIDLDVQNAHNNLFVAVGNEILRNPKHFGVPILAGFLRLFHISTNKKNHLKNVSLIVKSIIKKIRDKRTVNKLKRFLADIEKLLARMEKSGSSSEDDCPLIIPETPQVQRRVGFSNTFGSSEDNDKDMYEEEDDDDDDDNDNDDEEVDDDDDAES